MTKINTDPLDKNNNQNDKNRHFELRPKVFKVQESYICRSLVAKDLKTTYHIILSFVLYFFIANTFYYLTHPESLKNEYLFVISSLKHIEIFFIQQVVYTILLLYVFYPLTKIWITQRTKFSDKSTSIDIVFGLVMSSIVGLVFITSLATVILKNINPVMSVAIITDKIRITMKTIAFVFESKRKQEAALEKDKKDVKFSTRKQLLYFISAPTLVYRDEYPMLEKRDYKLLAKLCLQYAICLYFLMVIHCRILYPIFSKVGLGPIEGKKFIIDLSTIFLAGSAYCLLTFYSFLHLYSNITAQIFRFGDRVFYEDWWTCTDYSTYYRKWNILVHDWIYAYLYSPLVHILRGNRVLAGLLSIYISALSHEYIIIVAVRHINPILSILFAGFGAIFFVVNGLLNIAHVKKAKKAIKENDTNAEFKPIEKRKKEADVKSVDFAINNTLFLLGTFNGWFTMITIYYTGWFSLKNCLNNEGLFPTFSMDCLNIKF